MGGNTRCTGTPSPSRFARRRIFCRRAADALGIANDGDGGESGGESKAFDGDDDELVGGGDPGIVSSDGLPRRPTRRRGGLRAGKRERQELSRCPSSGCALEAAVEVDACESDEIVSELELPREDVDVRDAGLPERRP